MKGRIVAVVAVLLSLPVLVALVEAVSFHRSNANNGVLLSSDLQREYLLHVPRSYDGSRTALVISMHAAAVWPAVQRDISGWNTVADDHGFLVVYPSGLSTGGPRIWEMGGPEMKRDVQFIGDLIDDLRARYNIDPSRIYADGLSNGGGMAFVLSCTMPDRIAAVGMVGAALLVPFEWCPDRRPVPMMAFHGTGDTAAPYAGGRSWVTSIPVQNAAAFVDKWARRNQCTATREEPRLTVDVSRLTYHNCANGADVVFHTVLNGGHTWPGGQPVPEWFAGRTTNSINATREIWSFFQARRLH